LRKSPANKKRGGGLRETHHRVSGLVQHGLSAAGGVYGFYKHCSTADKR
jgi:hypothetical protein